MIKSPSIISFFLLYLEHVGAEGLSVVDVGVHDKVADGVADAEVVLGDLGLGGVKGHLVA